MMYAFLGFVCFYITCASLLKYLDGPNNKPTKEQVDLCCNQEIHSMSKWSYKDSWGVQHRNCIVCNLEQRSDDRNWTKPKKVKD